MKILRTYVLREHLAPFAVTVSGFTAVMLIGNVIKLAELVITKGVSPLDVVRLLIDLVPYMLSFTIPISTLMAMVMAFGRLSTDYELIAMRASGIPPARLIAPLLLTASLISGGMVLLNDRVVPASHLALRRQLKAIGIKHPTAYIEDGTFIKEFAPYIMFVYHVEGKLLYNVRIYEPQPNGPTRTIVANRGEFEPLKDERTLHLDLFDGTVDQWDPEHPGSFYKVSFEKYALHIATGDDADRRFGKKLKEMTVRELHRERERLAAESIDPLPITLQLHERIASSFATVVFALFGLSLGLGSHHHERLTIFVWVLGFSIAYYLASIGTNAIALKGWMPVWLVMWLPNLAAGAFGALRLYPHLRR